MRGHVGNSPAPRKAQLTQPRGPSFWQGASFEGPSVPPVAHDARGNRRPARTSGQALKPYAPPKAPPW
eukprot:7279069-Alexandrium_andersonii.AAC.1